MAAHAAFDKQAEDILVLKVGEVIPITDFFLICHGKTTRQVKAIVENVLEKLGEEGLKPQGIEGNNKSQWVLLDYGSVVIHIFLQEERVFYQLERLWRDVPKLDWRS
jgi:ribosome-associated protein